MIDYNKIAEEYGRGPESGAHQVRRLLHFAVGDQTLRKRIAFEAAPRNPVMLSRLFARIWEFSEETVYTR